MDREKFVLPCKSYIDFDALHAQLIIQLTKYGRSWTHIYIEMINISVCSVYEIFTKYISIFWVLHGADSQCQSLGFFSSSQVADRGLMGLSYYNTESLTVDYCEACVCGVLNKSRCTAAAAAKGNLFRPYPNPVTVKSRRDSDDVRLNITRPTLFVDFFYSPCSLRQQSAGRDVAPFGHIILIPSQPVFDFTP
jgi:hypothetical protein